MTSVTCKVPGKIHLLGEHAVVYGKPALLCAISKFVSVSCKPSTSDLVEISFKKTQASTKTTLSEIIDFTNQARLLWQEFSEKNDVNILKQIIRSKEDFIKVAIGEALQYIDIKPQDGFHLDVNLEFPIGSGLGSSGAVAGAVVGSLFAFFRKKIDIDEIESVVSEIEKRQHGNPSGADAATSLRGGVVLFKKTEGKKTIETLSLPNLSIISQNIYLIHTGSPIESTGEMVSFAREKFSQNEELKKDFLDSQEKLTNQILVAIRENDKQLFSQCIKLGQSNLDRIGVVSPFVKSIIRKIEKTGGVAKICGGGGITGPTGTLLIYHEDKTVLLESISEFNLGIEQVTLGVPGISISEW